MSDSVPNPPAAPTPRRGDARAEASARALEMEAAEARRRFEVLLTAGEVLSSPLDWDATLDHVIQLVVPVLADFGFFDVVEDDGAVRRIARAYDDPRRQAILDQSGWVRSDRADVNLCALSSGKSGFHPHIDRAWLEDAATSPEHLAVMEDLRFRSMITVPLTFQDEVLGALTLFYADSGRHHSEADLALAEEIGRRAAVAVWSARQVRTLKAERERLSFLAEASKVLSESLDYPATLRVLSDVLVPALADLCSIDLLSPDGTYENVVVAHRDPEQLPLVLESRRRMTARLREGAFLADVLESGRARLFKTISPDGLDESALDDEHVRLRRALGYRSALLLPLVARGTPPRRHLADHVVVSTQL